MSASPATTQTELSSSGTPIPPPTSSLLFTVEDSPARHSPSRSPRKIATDPSDIRNTDELRIAASFKRIVVCCDGTWQDGLSAASRAAYTNVLRLSRAVNHLDERFQPPVPQIVYYQSGVGTEDNLFSKYVEGTTGSSLVAKVEEAYAFIAHNYFPGDEIFLFGFSRGAYTARMIAMFIGEIGVLDRRDMDNFASIFLNFQALGKGPSPSEKQRLEEELEPWRKADAKGRVRADCDGDKFTVKCLGVWDTVGALGLPEELGLLTLGQKGRQIFGFRDRRLGEHIERAYQALALNEMRDDFKCTKFEQTPEGIKRKQVLKQCWFTGAHTDVGGGYDDHDLADITLTWMAANVSDALSLDPNYIKHLITPATASWGTQRPHDSGSKGVFALAMKSPRPLPAAPNDPVTHEMIHPSVLKQASLNPDLTALVKTYPHIVCELLPLEEEIKQVWPFQETSERAKAYAQKIRAQEIPAEKVAGEVIVASKSWFSKSIFRSLSQRGRPSTTITTTTRTKRTSLRVVEGLPGQFSPNTKLVKSNRDT